MEAEMDLLTVVDGADHPALAPDGPGLTFFRLVPGCRLPQRADRSAAGTMPTRAFRYCEALTSASAFGWYLFPPIGVSFVRISSAM